MKMDVRSISVILTTYISFISYTIQNCPEKSTNPTWSRSLGTCLKTVETENVKTINFRVSIYIKV